MRAPGFGYLVDGYTRRFPDYRRNQTRERRLAALEKAALSLCKHTDEHGIEKADRERVARVMGLLDDTFAPNRKGKK